MMGTRMVQGARTLQAKTTRTRAVEFMREPFGGQWLGEPGWFTVKQIAEGAEATERRAMRHDYFERQKIGRAYVYRIAP